ncbi:nucleoside-diphosphate-sugar epimerase [Fusarium tjaetaba]|uniref:Nucleoside-diphosphate-sugar epimerase n=1 Tax=Fusarium tjaetaba TaxID=1567544 RepID=A0A8H5VK20_9HYPO|nr:nucleoside-diphosphate-sugar epimerase [Fusarium tjaetaba]KAF5626281.1 nucleoside-diphosphate-sugar epimerase [Fusarium tjaetaba]
MAPKILLTGVTGFVGGTAFSKIHDAHPNYDYTLYIRSEDRANIISKKYPNVKFVYGDLASTDVIEKAASEADVVVHTAESADSLPAAKAIERGLTSGHSKENPGYYIHLSGAGILTWYDLKNQRCGMPPLPEQSYHDINDIDRILNLPNEAIHKDVDNAVQSIDSVPHCLARATFELGYTPFVGAGQAKWDYVHVEDLAEFFNKAIEATQDSSMREDPEVWGKKGYYFVSGGEHQWKDLAAWVADEVHRQGYIPESRTQSVTFEDVIKNGYKAGIAWAINSRGESERARKFLGWEPKAPSLKDTVSDSVTWKAEVLGLKPKYK